MKNAKLFYQGLKIISPGTELIKTNNYNKSITSTGTCLGACVKCGATCCMDAGHPGPHFCYFCM